MNTAYKIIVREPNKDDRLLTIEQFKIEFPQVKDFHLKWVLDGKANPYHHEIRSLDDSCVIAQFERYTFDQAYRDALADLIKTCCEVRNYLQQKLNRLPKIDIIEALNCSIKKAKELEDTDKTSRQ